MPERDLVLDAHERENLWHQLQSVAQTVDRGGKEGWLSETVRNAFDKVTETMFDEYFDDKTPVNPNPCLEGD